MNDARTLNNYRLTDPPEVRYANLLRLSELLGAIALLTGYGSVVLLALYLIAVITEAGGERQPLLPALVNAFDPPMVWCALGVFVVVLVVVTKAMAELVKLCVDVAAASNLHRAQLEAALPIAGATTASAAPSEVGPAQPPAPTALSEQPTDAAGPPPKVRSSISRQPWYASSKAVGVSVIILLIVIAIAVIASLYAES